MSNYTISRQAAKEAYCKHFCHRGVACPDTLCKEVNEAFDELPSAQPEQKKGQWIIFDSDNERYEVIKCSKCGFLFTVDASMWCDIGQTKEDFIHCPHCGVKMEGA